METPITADYVLQMAERIEQNGREFYEMAADMASDPGGRNMLLQLAGAEARHRETFAAIREGFAEAPPLDLAGETAGYIRALLAGSFFDIDVSPAEYLAGGESFRDVLLTAIRLEKETIVFYEGLRRVLVGGEGEQALEAVIGQEMGHLTELVGGLGMLDA